MQEFTCADVSGKLWAAARVNPGDTVFFLQWNGTKWNAEDSDSVCGTASAGLPSRSCPTADKVTGLWQSSLQKVGAPDVKLNGERHRDHRPSLRAMSLKPC